MHEATTKYAIIQAVKRMSYSLVGERYGLTRNQVAGIVWRHKNPVETRVYPEGHLSGRYRSGRTINGRGYGNGPYPPKTQLNTRYTE